MLWFWKIEPNNEGFWNRIKTKGLEMIYVYKMSSLVDSHRRLRRRWEFETKTRLISPNLLCSLRIIANTTAITPKMRRKRSGLRRIGEENGVKSPELVSQLGGFRERMEESRDWEEVRLWTVVNCLENIYIFGINGWDQLQGFD